MLPTTPTSIRKCPCNNGLQLEVDCRLGSFKLRTKQIEWIKLQRCLNQDDSESNKIYFKCKYYFTSLNQYEY